VLYVVPKLPVTVFIANSQQIGFEIWTMQNDILFDNIYIGHSIKDAEKLKAETFDVKLAAEKAEEEANRPKTEETPQPSSDISFKDDPVIFVKEKVNLFVEIAKRDPLEAIKLVPEVAGGIGALGVAILAILASLLFGSSAAPSQEQIKAKAKKAKATAVDAKDKAAEAVATGAETAKTEVNKRTTRASS